MDSGASKEACIRWGAHWRNMVNTIEPSVCGGDAAFCQITWTTRGVQRFRRLTQLINQKICTSHFVTFQHSFLQLKCTWSSFSPKLEIRYRRIAFSQPLPCRLHPPKGPSHEDLDPHLIHGSVIRPTRVHTPDGIWKL